MKQAQLARLQRLEQQAEPKHGGLELWVGTGDNEMLSPTGEVITVRKFARRYPDAINLCAGPKNER